MLSRVANHTYWLGRYLERAEDMARTMTVHDHMLMDLSEFDRGSTWYQLIAVNSNEALFAEQFDNPSEQDILQFLVTNLENPSSTVSALSGARYNLRACRSVLPKAMYELVNEVCLAAADVSGKSISATQRRSFLNSIEHQLLAIAGAATGSMSYNKAFLFMSIGCFLERADMTSRIIDVRSADLLKSQNTSNPTPYENSQWIAILQSLQAYQMYMSEVRRPINGPDVLDFVLKNLDHPKSFRFCIQRLESFIQRLPYRPKLQHQVKRLLEEVDAADVHQLAQDQSELHQFIDSLQVSLAVIGNEFDAQFFPSQEQTQEQIQEQSQEQK
ncbi:MAG: putative alpha-E superfamily protein [Granulosicoccus sp.]|jgi:uncharacterized alpha-E superfamily protein